MDKAKIDEFWNRRASITSPRIATHFKEDDTLDYDVSLIESLLSADSKVLDLGCGTGAVTNRIADKVQEICAVDKQAGFLEHITRSPGVRTVQSDVLGFFDTQRYDMILLFGVMNYFSEREAEEIYANCSAMLSDGGTLLVKHACGVQDTVVVDQYSEEIQDHYHAVYRHVDIEQRLLCKQFKVEKVDIYPDHLNRWENTHFYAFVCHKRAGGVK